RRNRDSGHTVEMMASNGTGDGVVKHGQQVQGRLLGPGMPVPGSSLWRRRSSSTPTAFPTRAAFRLARRDESGAERHPLTEWPNNRMAELLRYERWLDSCHDRGRP